MPDPIPNAVPVEVKEPVKPEFPGHWAVPMISNGEWITFAFASERNARSTVKGCKSEPRAYRMFRLPSDAELAAARAKREEQRERIEATWRKAQPGSPHAEFCYWLLTEVLPEEVQP